MVNYYKVLRVSPDASRAEIKSAYRRLARTIHPDINDSTANNSREFARIVKAYKVLGNPKKRAEYDRRRLRAQFNSAESGVFSSENSHARRLRQIAYERRYNAIIDRMIADERKESMALQHIIFPTVALFVSTIFVAVFRPVFFTQLHILGKLLVVGLFVAGLVHLGKRIQTGLARYTYAGDLIHDSILAEEEPEEKPYTRSTAIAFLVISLFVCIGVGWVIGDYLELFIAAARPTFFSSAPRLEFILYPPIFVLCVDAMHAFATRLEG